MYYYRKKLSMRICLVTENYDPNYGGQFTAIQNVINICKSINIKYFIIHKKSRHYKNQSSLEKNINKSDIIHLFGGWTFFYLKIQKTASKFKKKIIIHPMGLFDPQSFKQKKIKKEIAWKLYQKKMLLDADLIHCGSYLEEQNLKKLNNKFKTIVLPFSIDQADLKKKFSKNIHRRCIFFSRLHNQKGLDKLLKAWKIVADKNWKLDIVGFGDNKFYKKKFKLNQYKNIKFFKPVTIKQKKFKLFDNYDFFALPSISESFGLAILESLGRRVPVLTTNKTPWIDIQKKNSGWIINDSFVELKLVLYEIFNTSKKDFLLKKRNTIKVARNYETRKISRLYLNTYKKILSK